MLRTRSGRVGRSIPRAGAVLVAVLLALAGSVALVSTATASDTGTVTGRATLPAGTTWAYVQVIDTQGVVVNDLVAFAADIDYTVTVPPGVYVVRLTGDRAYLADTYYPASADPAGATAVTVRAGEVTSGIDLAGTPAGALSGRVSLPAGFAGEVAVGVYDAAGVLAATSWVDPANPGYDVSGLPAGTYRVAFQHMQAETTLAAEYYDDVPDAQGLAAARAVTVTAGAERTGVDATLAVGGTARGRVLGSDGTPIAGARLTAYAENGSLAARTATTGLDGRFTLGGLSTASYSVSAEYLMGTEPSTWEVASVTVGPVAARLGQSTDLGTLTLVPPFRDVSFGGGFVAEIAWLAQQGISEGYAVGGGAREFRPADTVSRADMAAFLYRLAGRPAFTPPTTTPFTDVPKSHWFYEEITWLAAQGITLGYDVGGGKRAYRPDEPVLREHMAAFLYRFTGSPAYTAPGSPPFRDVPRSHGFYREIAWLADRGITAGYAVAGGAREYRPGQPVLREQMAAFMYRHATA